MTANIALNKPAMQSSAHRPGRSPAQEARLGNNGDIESSRCFLTGHEREPWWQVDLQGLYRLRRATIYNRIEHRERLNHFSVLRSHDGREWIECARRSRREPFSEITLDVPDAPLARFVRIRLDGTGFLHFRECELVGDLCDAAEAERLRRADEDLLQRRRLLPADRRGEIVEVGGLFVFVDELYGPKVQAALRAGSYEQIEREMAAQFLAPGDRVLEAGGAIGVVAMAAARIVGAANVLTFDANPNMTEDARQNFHRNGMEAIEAVHGALANRRRYKAGATARFGLADEFWASRLAGEGEPDIVAHVEAPLHGLEDAIESFGANVLICDIEGAEVDLLSGADLSRLRLLILETHYWARGEAATDALIAELIQAGFAIHLGASRHNVVVMRRHPAAARADAPQT